jgi:hypothetical protein
VIKTATKLFPKQYLGKVELPIRGTVVALTSVYEGVELLAFVYCDRDQHYFISTCSNVAGGDPIRCTRLQQLQLIETDKPPERVEIMNCPQSALLYYTACGKIDQHNRCRQSGLDLEKKIQTKSWHKRVNLSIFGMIVVDSYLLHQECTGGRYSQHWHYQLLIKDLLENGLQKMWRQGPDWLKSKEIDVIGFDWQECWPGITHYPNQTDHGKKHFEREKVSPVPVLIL